MPQFPDFKSVNLASAHFINEHTSHFEPYSDFNFISLWSWDPNGERKYSILNNNLVVLFTDYTTDEPFLSVLGNQRMDETVTKLLEYSALNNLPNELRMVPEITVESLSDAFQISADESHFDYIFSLGDLKDYEGSKYKNKRQLARKFSNLYSNVQIVQESASSPEAQVKIFELLKTWAEDKIKNGKDLDLKNEQTAILRALKAADNDLKILLTTLSTEDKIVAFSIDEIVTEDYAISHFFKTDHEHTGCTEFFNSKLAEILIGHGVKYWNWEQDLGLTSLRDVKSRYRPAKFLKKFTVRELSH